MQGNPVVIDTLNQLLAGELTARDQYFIHARMYQNWGFNALFTRIWHEMEEETEHASRLIERILFLGGAPTVVPALAPQIGADVPAMFQLDLDAEYGVVASLRAAIAVCEQAGDYVSRELLESLLKDTEEDHTHWLEQQLKLIGLMGIANYLQSQAG